MDPRYPNLNLPSPNATPLWQQIRDFEESIVARDARIVALIAENHELRQNLITNVQAIRIAGESLTALGRIRLDLEEGSKDVPEPALTTTNFSGGVAPAYPEVTGRVELAVYDSNAVNQWGSEYHTTCDDCGSEFGCNMSGQGRCQACGTIRGAQS